jgi:glutamate synthase (NADPH/NADH) small chain
MTKRFIANDDGQVIGVRCAPVRWHSTTSGKAPREIGGAESDLPADVVVLAVGFDPVLDVQLAEQLGLEVDGRNKPLVDNFASSVPGVFIAGDLATGAHLVAGALHTGRKAAGRINEYLSRLSASRAAAAAATADAPAEDAAHSA